ncbi:MAG TPA: hypothetical protein VH061_04640 [Solirubrobacteraceae bacterium]|jgi:hypothetical protein|nr:hypothetical protein [Solirubrobacteraceae bacterium]
MRQRNRLHVRLAGTLAATALLFGAMAASSDATRTISLNETGRLRLVSKHGFTLNETGTASGTIKGPISVRLTIVSTSRVSVEVTLSPNGGSVSGSGTASYHKGETEASFSGGLSIAKRSGSYAHAQGAGLKFSGTIARSNDAITVYVSGRLSY